MKDSITAFELPREQQETASRLEVILGKAIADRYVDFWRLAAGAFDLQVGRPVAAHALRELDSTLRTVLAVPMDAVPPTATAATEERDASAKKQLKALGYDDDAVARALIVLQPRISHKTQIERICERLGEKANGETASLWKAISGSAGSAHARSFHQSLEVDDDFRAKFQVPFDRVIRAVALALEAKYVSLLRRVEHLSSMSNQDEAAKLFAREIPNALPLQRHFYERLQTGDWLTPLSTQGLLQAPAWNAEDKASNPRFFDWPAGDYMVRMASSDSASTRMEVTRAIRALSPEHPAVRSCGLQISAALPAEEAETLSEQAVVWLEHGGEAFFQKAAQKYLANLATAGKKDAVLLLAHALLQVRKDGDKVATNYESGLYEHELPEVATLLVRTCALDGLSLLITLLRAAGEISGELRYGLYAQDHISDDEDALYDVFPALLSAVRRAAEYLVDQDSALLRPIVRLFEAQPEPLFRRLALHALAKRPAADPQSASAYLLDPELIDASWCSYEYAELALAWFPSLPAHDKTAILEIVDSLPDKYRMGWRERFTQHEKSPPVEEDERKFEARVYRDTTWRWRAVLPPERQVEIEQILSELGDPDSWKEDLWPEEESPLGKDDLLHRSVSSVAEYLQMWKPEEGSRQTVSALARALRDAIGHDPVSYAASANLFTNLQPIYVRELFSGISNAVANQRKVAWPQILVLIDVAYKNVGLMPATTHGTWSEAAMAGSELLMSGLRRGAHGIDFEHADSVQCLLLSLIQFAPAQPELSDFEERFARDPNFAAHGTLRGIASELCVLFISWRLQDSSCALRQAPQEALGSLKEVSEALEQELSDRTRDGRVPRAILGRYLTFLRNVGEGWVKRNASLLFPSDNAVLRRAAWTSHLLRDSGPGANLLPELKQCYEDEIALLPSAGIGDDRNARPKRLAEYLTILAVWSPDACVLQLVDQFLKNASPSIRGQALACVGRQAARSSVVKVHAARTRAFEYWEDRLSKARSSVEPDAFREEIGALGLWFNQEAIDNLWLLNQLREALKAGFVPRQSLLVMRRLAKIAADHPSSVVEVLLGMLRNSHTDRWLFFDRGQIREILQAGFSSGSPQVIEDSEHIVGILSSRGDTSFLDLLRKN